MSMRVLSACWFDMAVPAEAFEDAAEILAGSSQVELDMALPKGQADTESASLAPDLARCRELMQRYRDFLPQAQVPPRPPAMKPAETLKRASAVLLAWERATAQARDHVADIHGELKELKLWREFVTSSLAAGVAARVDGKANLDGELTQVLLVLPPKTELQDYPEKLVACRVANDAHGFLLLLGARDAVRAFERSVGHRLTARLSPPDWLQGVSVDGLKAVDLHITDATRRLDKEREVLGAANARLAVADAMGAIRRIEWSMENLGGVHISDYLAHIQGWTTDAGGQALVSLLLDAGIPGVIAFPPVPWGKIPPTLSSNPSWARPFELFVRLLGVPGPQEPDPSRLLSVIAPLLFGYMFGDVGQGVVLLLAGILLRRRWPPLALLISGGISAMVFGLLFGSVFGLDRLIPPLWVGPMEAPIEVLFVPIAGGAALIVLGMILGGVGAFWSGHLADWLRVDAGLLIVYCGAALLAVWPDTGAGTIIAGVVWCIAGSAWQAYSRGAGAIFSGLALLLERAFQFVVNTLSFVRVGAFALAHAGLSLAVVSLAAAAHGVVSSFIILLAGNALILGLEGLVVFVQTTRLILFEFFTRFLKAEGREFHPSRPPAAPQ